MAEHIPVMLQEVIEGLAIQADGIYVDATFGRGGHSQAILSHLSAKGRLLALDKDTEAVEAAQKQLGGDKRFVIHHASFAEIQPIAQEEKIEGRVNGVLFDLGVSSPQLDAAERGFSFMREGPLDMRMDKTQKKDAAYIIQHSTERQLEKLFREYGEERYARRIARFIVEKRAEAPIRTTTQLAEIVKTAHPKWEVHKHPATRVFQALRIEVNQELEALKKGLKEAFEILKVGGRLVVLSFHSLEDRIVKQFMKRLADGDMYPVGVPIQVEKLNKRLKKIGKALSPSQEENRRNVRARSAVLRIGEKLA